jgi:hypothetical protein
MRHFLILLFYFLFNATYINGQQIDTIYFNKNWIQTTGKSFKYYRIARQDSNKIAVYDYYKSGRLQSSGAYTTFEFNKETGPFYYFKKNRLYHMEIYEPTKYQNNLSKFTSILALFPPQADSLNLSIFFYKNKKIKSIGYVSECCFTFGPWISFSRHGDLLEMVTRYNNKLDGPYFMYKDNKIVVSGSFKDDKRDDEWKFYDSGGILRNTIYFKTGKKVKKIR